MQAQQDDLEAGVGGSSAAVVADAQNDDEEVDTSTIDKEADAELTRKWSDAVESCLGPTVDTEASEGPTGQNLSPSRLAKRVLQRLRWGGPESESQEEQDDEDETPLSSKEVDDGLVNASGHEDLKQANTDQLEVLGETAVSATDLVKSEPKVNGLRRRKGSKSVGMSLAEWRKHRLEKLRRRSRHSYKQRRGVPDELASGKRKKRSALHGTGVSKWYAAKNWYYSLLDTGWGTVFALATLLYISTIFFFSLVSWAVADDIECEAGMDTFQPGTLGIAAVFATSNIITLSSSVCLPADFGAFALASLQQYVGLILNVIVLSVVVSKFQVPKPDVVFSKNVLVTTRDGDPVLLIRVGNRRVNLIYETRVAVAMLSFHETREGESYVSYEQLKVQFPPTMTAVATIIHYLDKNSPLRYVLRDPDEMQRIALTVSFIGHDSVYNDDLVCTTQYKGTDLELGGVLFANMMEKTGNKGIRANFDKFDGLRVALEVGHEDLMNALDSGDDSDDLANGDEIELISRSRSRLKRLTSHRAGWARRRGSRARELLRNDVTKTSILTELPEELISGTVYLCYGGVLVKNFMVRLCPYSRFIYMFLVESGINHQVVDIDWDNKPDWFLEGSPLGRTPAILYDGKWVSNTRDIMKFLYKTFPDHSARINRHHNLPLAPWSIYDMLEKYCHQLVFSSPEFIQEMRELSPDDPRARKCSSAFKTGTNFSSYASDMETIKRERVWASKPPSNANELFLAVAVYPRGDTFVRCCPETQKIELLLRHTGISYNTVLVNIDEDMPEWISRVPTLFGPGPEDCVTVGTRDILNFLMERFAESLHQLPTRIPLEEALRRCDGLDEAAQAYVLRPDAEEAGVELEEKLLENVKVHLSHFENELREGAERSGVDADGFTWASFLSGKKISLCDIIISTHLHHVMLRLLTPFGGIRLRGQGFPFLQRYLDGMAATRQFKETSIADFPEPFHALNQARKFQKEYGKKLPRRCHVTDALVEAEKKALIEIQNNHGDVSRPPLEVNEIYLAVGSVKRGESLAKVCPYSRVIEMVAHEAGIPKTVIEVDLLNKPNWFTRVSNGKCPQLYWSGQWISESSVILEKLKFLFPEQFSKVDLPHHLDLEPFRDVNGMDLFNNSSSICEAYLVAKRNDSELEAKKTELVKLLSSIDRHLKGSGGPFLQGDRCSINDCALISAIWRFVIVGCRWFHGFDIVALGLEHLNAWIQQFEQRESFKTSIPSFPEPFIVKYIARFFEDKRDPENSIIKTTPMIERREKDALAKLRLQEASARGADAENSICLLIHLEELYKVIDDQVQQNKEAGKGGYLCGSSMGLADVLIFGSLQYLEDGVAANHHFNVSDRGFPHLKEYMHSVREKIRFRDVLSPAWQELFRIHVANRLSSTYPYLQLQRAEREHLELAAIAKVTQRSSKGSIKISETASSSSFATSSNSVSTNSNGGGGDVEDLLFCI